MRDDPVAFRRLHPATFLTRTLRAVPQFGLGIPALVGIASDIALTYLLLVAAAGLIAAAGGAWLYWRRFRYGLGSGELIIESGLLHRQRRVIPFDRIQDIDIEQGMLARLFGTAKVTIETGGSVKDEGTLDSVALSEAHALRESLRHGAAAASDAKEVPITADSAEEPVLFAMDLQRLLLAGLYNFSFFYLAFIFAGHEYLGAFGIDLLEMDWTEPARMAAERLTWLISLFVIVVLLLVTVAASILRTIGRDYRFRLTLASSGYRRRRGLFTLSEVVIPFRRVQVAVLSAGPIMRLTRWWKLDFQTLGSDSAKATHPTAMPFGRMGEALHILREIHPEPFPPHEDFIRVSTRHILRQTLRWSGLLAVPVVAVSWRYPIALLALAAIPFLGAAAALQWRHHRYCLTATHLYIGRGLFGRRLWLIPFLRIQAVRVRQGPLRRQLGLAGIDVDAAGTPAFAPLHIASLPEPVAQALARRLLDAHQAARDRLRPGREKHDGEL